MNQELSTIPETVVSLFDRAMGKNKRKHQASTTEVNVDQGSTNWWKMLRDMPSACALLGSVINLIMHKQNKH